MKNMPKLPDGWKEYKLSEITAEITETAGNKEYETLSISAGIGFVNQAKKFGKELSGNQYEKYIVLHKGDFSYNKGNSKKYPQGCIYQLKNRDAAAVPNVFESFRFKVGINDFFEQLFLFGFLNKQLFSKINHGVRDDGLLNLTGKDFYDCSIPFPPLPEQQKIAKILSTQDKVIELKEKLLEQKQLRKKYLMLQLLSGARRILEENNHWKTIYLKSISKKVNERNSDFKYTLVLSNSAQHGIIPQSDQFDKDIANDENIDGYYVVRQGDFVYNPRISVTAPCGPINVNDYGSIGVMSPLYLVFSVKSAEVDNIYLKHYFKSSLWHNYLKSVANYGARHDRMAISNEDFFMMPIFLPPLPEQQAIVEVLSTADKEIDLLKSEIEQEKLKKKSLMQLLLTGIVRVKV